MANDILKLRAIEIAKENPNNFSVSLLQKELKIGYIACNKLMDILENEGIISQYDKDKRGRKVLI